MVSDAVPRSWIDNAMLGIVSIGVSRMPIDTRLVRPVDTRMIDHRRLGPDA